MNINTSNIWSQKIIVSPYCRVSTDSDDQANSLESQIKYFSSFIKNHPNWSLGEIYYDEGISGTSIKKRKNFNRLINDALSGKVQFIITKEVSRFARNTVDTLVFTRQLKERGVGVYFVIDNINTLDSDGELRLTIMASLAQEESRKTSERVKWGIKRRMEAGVVFGQDLLGYEVTGGKISIKPEEAKLIKEVFNRFLDGEGSSTLAKMLRERGAKSRWSKQWHSSTIMKMLRNVKYVGDLCQRKTYVTNYLTHHRANNRDPNEMIYISDHHEAIIDRETFNKVQEEIAKRQPSEELKSKYSNRHWCSGKFVCGECGRKFTKNTLRFSTGKLHEVWRCIEACKNGKKKVTCGIESGCANNQLNQRVILYCINDSIKFVKQNEMELISEMLSELKQVHTVPATSDTASIVKKIDELQNLKSKTVDLVLRGLLTDDDLKRQNNFYDKEIESLGKQLNEAQRANSLIDSNQFDTQKYTAAIKKILSLEEDCSALYKELVEKIIFYKDRSLQIYLYHLPFSFKYKYSVSGMRSTYKIEILSFDIIYKQESE